MVRRNAGAAVPAEPAAAGPQVEIRVNEPTMADAEPLHSFCARYVEFCHAFGVDQPLERLAFKVPPAFYPQFQQARRSAPRGATDFQVVDAFLSDVGQAPDPATDRDTFEALTLLPDETLAQFGSRLSAAAVLAFPDYTVKQRETFVVDKFVKALATGKYSHVFASVRNANPQTLSSAIGITQRALTTCSLQSSAPASAPPASDIATTAVSERNIFAVNQARPFAHNHGQRGMRPANPRGRSNGSYRGNSRGNGRNYANNRDRCFTCNGFGHRAASCTTSTVSFKLQCFSCEGYGHRSNDCPNVKGPSA